MHVAIKAVHPNLAHDQKVRREILGEFRIQKPLTHQHIVAADTIEESGPTDPYYFVMEYVDGSNLDEYRKKQGGRLTPTEAIPLLRELADALDSAHLASVAHCDVKPANVMITKEGRVKLLDFGLAKPLTRTIGSDTALQSTLTGTPLYMAPEQWNDRHPNEKTDQYALAALTCEMLSGSPPFVAKDMKVLQAAVLNQHPPRPKQIPLRLWRVLARGLAKDPGRRYANCTTLVVQLEKAAKPLSFMKAAALCVAVLIPISLLALRNLGVEQEPRMAARESVVLEGSSSTPPSGESPPAGRAEKTRPAVDRPNSHSSVAVPIVAPTAAQYGTLVIRTIPSEASIRVDGKRQGIAPLKLPNVIEGVHTLKVEHADYADLDTTVHVSADQTVERVYPLVPLPAALSIVSDPANARVIVDGSETGKTTPCKVEVPALKKVKVGLRKEGYSPVTVESSLEPRRHEHLTVKLNRLPGYLLVHSRPPEAQVTVRGAQVETNMMSGSRWALSSGEYAIEISKPGYRPDLQQVHVEPGETSVVHAELHDLGSDLTIVGVVGPSGDAEKPSASIIVGEEDLGTHDLPYTIRGLSPGLHEIRLEGPLWKKTKPKTVRVGKRIDLPERTLYFRASE